ncbi:phospholipid methyltransferase [Leptospira meyeri]|uniref:Phospholipid methyltransferase n=1 Tax=Leptospira meyeri TaxID=29508 RepID=A0A4R8MV28_LEPME|nr:isoprenylcysteine carboxylmethyltransferase family protein [Leptospira meyeri]EKJ85558.1 phospholipid methyltransferase [Leptospira meyeri serovar Hardjo str. Went 5]TDY71322.1 phospholipid methyltransferase [Leptospira meyeri]
MLIETVLVGILFSLYIFLWKTKRVIQKKKTGKDPEVIGQSKSNLQALMNILFKAITYYVILIIGIHTLKIDFFGLNAQFNLLVGIEWDITGFIVGLFGLCFCLYAQIKMKNSWRVGIDENSKEDLITDGIFRFVRNPTYLGLFLLNLGVCLIWPTHLVFYLNIIFVLIFEIQVRCEEDFLENLYGEEYRLYKNKSYRYIPFIY